MTGPCEKEKKAFYRKSHTNLQPWTVLNNIYINENIYFYFRTYWLWAIEDWLLWIKSFKIKSPYVRENIIYTFFLHLPLIAMENDEVAAPRSTSASAAAFVQNQQDLLLNHLIVFRSIPNSSRVRKLAHDVSYKLIHSLNKRKKWKVQTLPLQVRGDCLQSRKYATCWTSAPSRLHLASVMSWIQVLITKLFAAGDFVWFMILRDRKIQLWYVCFPAHFKASILQL